jgi:hypothetical protein
LRLDCTILGTCDVKFNTVVGSGAGAGATGTNDTCLESTGSGVEINGISGSVISENHLHDCGYAGFLFATNSGAINLNNNDILFAGSYGIMTPLTATSEGGQSNIIGNQISTDPVSGIDSILLVNGHNVNVAYNQLQSTGGGFNIRCVGTSGLGCKRNKFSGNYAVSGIYIQSKGVCGGACTNSGNVCSRDIDCTGISCGASHDGCAAYATNDNIYMGENNVTGTQTTKGFWVENGTNIIIHNNGSSGTASTTDNDFVRLTQLDNTADGPIQVTENTNAGGSGSGTHRCVEVENPETTGASALINDLMILGNECGSGDIGINFETTLLGGSGLYIKGNNLRQ